MQIENPYRLTDAEKNKMQALCRYNNFALFEIAAQENTPEAIVQLNQQFGLVDYDQHLYVQNDGLAHITQSDKQQQAEFIPYTDKAIGWHTDGYYNADDNRIRAFSLFCVNPASVGGVNQWIDLQMAYILLREDNAEVVEALSHPQAMTIPAHIVDGTTRREVSVGSIFFIDEPTNELSMRYTQRKRNIEFYNSTEVKQAVELLDELLNANTSHHFEHAMQTNQGLICNNILHKRSAFTDNSETPRLLLRGRYTNRISL
ncbi:hypothetical protein SPONL_1002 [uncultured Candidatus Thioglobus sp.]|nr:hypothetical protein SPONL_1002 [uncultured Candidatus Thioglobus sp.]